jgi:hypothetical protein
MPATTIAVTRTLNFVGNFVANVVDAGLIRFSFRQSLLSRPALS